MEPFQSTNLSVPSIQPDEPDKPSNSSPQLAQGAMLVGAPNPSRAEQDASKQKPNQTENRSSDQTEQDRRRGSLQGKRDSLRANGDYGVLHSRT